LRERVEDIQRLAEHFLQDFATKYQRPALRISQDSYQRLFDYTWPGKVRELQSVLERAVLLCKGDTLTIEALPFGQAASEGMAVGASVAVRTPAAAAE